MSFQKRIKNIKETGPTLNNMTLHEPKVNKDILKTFRLYYGATL